MQKFMHFLSNLRTFCVILFTDGVNLGTYCENLRTSCVIFCTNVEIKTNVWKTRAFHWFIPLQTICRLNALLLHISKCRESHVFSVIFLPQKLQSHYFFDNEMQIENNLWTILKTCDHEICVLIKPQAFFGFFRN